MYNYGYTGYEHMFGWGIFGLLLMVLIWVIVISIVVRIVARIVGGPRYGGHGWRHWRPMAHGDSALNILNERYAKGEINKDEFEQKKKDILG
jgi:putative membrane protein